MRPRLPRSVVAVAQRWPAVVWLVAVWCLLWGSVQPGTALAGVLVAVGVLSFGRLPRARRDGVLRPLPALRFLAVFLYDLVRSTVLVARLVLQRRVVLRQAVVGATLPDTSDTLLTLVSGVATLTPGTVTLEVDRPRSALFFHVLDTDDVEESRADLDKAFSLALRAFGTSRAKAAADEWRGRGVAPVERGAPGDGDDVTSDRDVENTIGADVGPGDDASAAPTSQERP